MPSRKTTKAAEAAAAKLPTIPKELIDQFVTGPMSPEAVQAASMAFKTEQDRASAQAMEALAKQAQELQLGYE